MSNTVTPPAAPSPEAGLERAVSSFLHAMEAVAELAKFASEHVDTLDDVDAAVAAEAGKSLSGLSDETRKQAAILLRQDAEGAIAEKAAAETRLGRELNDDERRELWNPHIRGMRDELQVLTDEPHAYMVFVRARTIARRRPSRIRVMRQSLLITATSDFEVLVASLIREFVTLRPDILKTSDQRYSLADIEGYSDLKEFRQACAERFAEGLMRGGLEEWMDWFEKRHKLPFSEVTSEPERLRETFQRRHLLVHNGGVVNGIYLAKTNGKPPHAPGQKLGVGEDYLSKAIDVLTLAGLRLAFMVMRKAVSGSPGSHPADHFTTMTVYDLLVQGRNHLVVDLVDSNSAAFTDQEQALFLRVNGWIAKKRLGGVEAVKEEVEAWPTGVLDDRFKLAKLALLDKNAAAYDLVKQLLDQGTLDTADWRDWPLLEGVRTFEVTSADVAIEEEPKDPGFDQADGVDPESDDGHDTPPGPSAAEQ